MDDFELPPYAHIPGQNPRHGHHVFEKVLQSVPPQTTSDKAHENPAWGFGLKLLELGFYWEVHEVLEPVWQNALPNSREKYFIRGVIQLANAALKVEMTRKTASLRLVKLSIEEFENAKLHGQSVMQCDVDGFIAQAHGLEQSIAKDSKWRFLLNSNRRY